ncbi:MAG: hypothetical protein JXQ29_00925, partial [Planctomycetes bacterium]|nr:hypothetical protein [Planctomycetota bacterium]
MRQFSIAILAAVLVAGLLPVGARADEVGQKAKGIVDAQAPAIVSIQVVLDLEAGGQTREQRLRGHGVAVSDTGLIMTSIETIKPNLNARGPRGQRLSVKITPADIKIVFEKDEKEYDAFVVVRDTKRQIVFLQLKSFKPADRKISFVDFSKSATPKVGDEYITVHRLAKGYDYAPLFSAGRIIGELTKPRKALLVSHAAPSGLPAFSLEGKLIGCHSRMRSGLEEGAAREAAGGQPIVLPAKDIDAVIKQALKTAAAGEPAAGGEEDEED